MTSSWRFCRLLVNILETTILLCCVTLRLGTGFTFRIHDLIVDSLETVTIEISITMFKAMYGTLSSFGRLYKACIRQHFHSFVYSAKKPQKLEVHGNFRKIQRVCIARKLI